MSSEKMGDLQVQLAEIESSSIFESNEKKNYPFTGNGCKPDDAKDGSMEN